LRARSPSIASRYRYLTDLFKALPYARSADDYEALPQWNLGKSERAIPA